MDDQGRRDSSAVLLFMGFSTPCPLLCSWREDGQINRYSLHEQCLYRARPDPVEQRPGVVGAYSAGGRQLQGPSSLVHDLGT